MTSTDSTGHVPARGATPAEATYQALRDRIIRAETAGMTDEADRLMPAALHAAHQLHTERIQAAAA